MQKSSEIKIFRSVPKLLVMSGIILGFALVLGWIALQRFLARDAEPLDQAFYWICGLAAFAVLLLCIRVLPLWRHVASPFVILSRDGITFPGKPTLAWSDLTENDWHYIGVGPFVAGATLVVRTRGNRHGGEALTLACNAKEYFRHCDSLRHKAGPKNV